MKSLRGKKPRYIWKTIVLPSCILGAMLVVFILGILKFESINTEQNLILTEQAIRKATIQCYANEGRYPADLSYLEENYGVTIDYTKFNVVFDSVAANIIPNIEVFAKAYTEEEQ